MAATSRHELGVFLRTRRARLLPQDVGLPTALGRRRTPGLRREEVAQLSGVGVTWYTWLEQGRPITTSGQVIDALARALRLDPDEHRHLRTLAGLPAGTPDAGGDDPARLRHLVDALLPNPASVYDRHFDFLSWNAAYARIRHDPATLPADRRNMLWMMFTDGENRSRMYHWEPAARAVLAQFRVAADRHPDDPRFAELVTALTAASPEFAAWWPDHRIREFKPATIPIDHPDAGLIRLDLYQMRPVEHPELVLVLQVPATDEDARRVHAMVSAVDRPSGTGHG